MKNQYMKFVKYLEKQKNIFVQRSGESVYMTDGKVVLMLPVILYDNMVRPLSGLLPELKEDCTGEKRFSDVFVTIRANGLDIKKAVDSLNTDKIIKQSCFLVELPSVRTSKKPVCARIFKADGGDIIGINEIFVDMFNDLRLGEPWRGAGRRNCPIVRKADGFTQVIFPIMINSESFEIWKDV